MGCQEGTLETPLQDHRSVTIWGAWGSKSADPPRFNLDQILEKYNMAASKVATDLPGPSHLETLNLASQRRDALLPGLRLLPFPPCTSFPSPRTRDILSGRPVTSVGRCHDYLILALPSITKRWSDASAGGNGKS